jgi:hypothetical protein
MIASKPDKEKGGSTTEELPRSYFWLDLRPEPPDWRLLVAEAPKRHETFSADTASPRAKLPWLRRPRGALSRSCPNLANIV